MTFRFDFPSSACRAGIWASLETMLVFLFLLAAMLPVLNYAHFASIQKEEWARAQARLSDALSEAEWAYSHGASVRPNPLNPSLVRAGRFDAAAFALYVSNPAHPGSSKTIFHYYAPPQEPPRSSNQICVMRMMEQAGQPAPIFVCDEGA